MLSPWWFLLCCLLLIPKTVHMSLGTRHVRSRASLNKFPLSPILPQRSNTAIYSYWFMSISTANIHTTPLDFFHFPSHPHRDAGYINSSWADKFRALLEEKWWNIRKREAFLALLFFAAGSEETAVQTAGMTGHGAGASYETGSRAGPHMEPWLSAGLRSPLCTLIVDLYTVTAPKICCNQPGNLLWERLVKQLSL